MTTRPPRAVHLPVGDAVRERWRAAGAWTDETLIDRSAARAAHDAARELIVDRDRRLTGLDVRVRAERVAAALHSEGIGPGDVVFYQLPNWWESVALAWGILLAGAVASPLTPTLRHAEVEFVLAQTGARLAVVPRVFRGFDHAAMLSEIGFGGTTWLARTGELDAILDDDKNDARVTNPPSPSTRPIRRSCSGRRERPRSPRGSCTRTRASATRPTASAPRTRSTTATGNFCLCP